MMKKSRYKIDFEQHMHECELNYQRLHRLLPQMATEDQFAFGVTLPDGCSATVTVVVVERSKYTTTLMLCWSEHSSWLAAKDMVVRTYDDAHVAEVLLCHRGLHYQARYTYPNDQMYQEDEKFQRNRFLGECLRYCLDFGHSLGEIALA